LLYERLGFVMKVGLNRNSPTCAAIKHEVHFARLLVAMQADSDKMSQWRVARHDSGWLVDTVNPIRDPNDPARSHGEILSRNRQFYLEEPPFPN
jgi:hypothetical protein